MPTSLISTGVQFPDNSTQNTGGITITGTSISSNLTVGQASTFIITQFDSYTTYTISTTNGSVSRSGNIITYTPATAGTANIVINGRTIGPFTVDALDIITNGLSIYLDATNPNSYPGTGTTWSDLSGNGRNFTWNTVSYTAGSPSYFSTSGRTCTGPASNSVGINNTSGYTIFLVMLQNSLQPSGAFKFYKNNLSSSSGRAIFSHCTWNDGVIYFDQGGCCGTDTRTSVSAGTTNTWNVYTFRRLANSSTRTISKNGTTLVTNTNAAATIDLDSRAINLAGNDEYTNWDARLGGFIVYNRGLDDSEVTSVHNAIKARYGIA